MLFKSLYTRFVLIEQRSCISGDNFMKIGNLLLSIKFSRYIPIMSIYFTKSPSSIDTTRKIVKNLCCTDSAIVLLKLMFDI